MHPFQWLYIVTNLRYINTLPVGLVLSHLEIVQLDRGQVKLPYTSGTGIHKFQDQVFYHKLRLNLCSDTTAVRPPVFKDHISCQNVPHFNATAIQAHLS